MPIDPRTDDASRLALEDLAGEQARPFLARAERDGSAAAKGFRGDAYAAALEATGIEPDMAAIRLTFGE